MLNNHKIFFKLYMYVHINYISTSISTVVIFVREYSNLYIRISYSLVIKPNL